MNAVTSANVPSDRLINNFIHVNPGYVPVNTSSIIIPPEFSRHINLIAYQLIDNIQAMANKNPIRTILFNWMSVNSYNNQQFMNLLQYAVGMVILENNYQQGLSLEQLIFNAVGKSANHYIGLILIENPYLHNSINQEQVNVLRSFYNEYTRDFQAIDRILQEVLSRRNQQNNHYAYQHNQNAMVQNGQPYQQYSRVDNAGSGLFNRQPHSSASYGQTQVNQTKSVDRYDNDYDIKRVENNQQEIHTHRDNIARGNNVKPEEWKPSETYPFLFATDKTKVITLERFNDGLAPVGKQVKDIQMDRNKHYNVMESAQITATENVLNKDNSLGRINSTITEVKADSIVLNVKESDEYISDTSLRNTAFLADVSLRTMMKKDDSINVFRCNGMLLDMVACDIDGNALGDILYTQSNFTNCVVAMRTAKKSIEEGTNKNCDEISFNFFNRRLTESCNNFVKKNLGLPTGWMDSFVEDADSVLPFIMKQYGAKFAESMAKEQAMIINRAVNAITGKLKESMDEDYLSKLPEDQRPFTIYVDEEYTISSINLFSTELELNLPKVNVDSGVGTAVMERATPVFYKIARGSVDHAKSLGKSVHAYIKTLDNVFFEVCESYIDPNVLMVTII